MTENRQSHVLIVEDDESLTTLLKEISESIGLKVQTASKVSTSISKLANQKYDLVVLDMTLETGTGEQVVTALRKDEGHLNYKTPILVSSGTLEAEILKKIGKGVQGVLIKPFRREAYVEKVLSLIKN